MKTRLAIFATHPVQYHVPLWRGLAKENELEIRVFYFSDVGVRATIDPGFDVPVVWDIPLLDGYDFKFISRDSNLSKPWAIGIRDSVRLLKNGEFDLVMIQGYTNRFELQIIRAARKLGVKVLMRAEFSDKIGGGSRIKGILRNIYLGWFYEHVDVFCYIGQEAKRHLLDHGVHEDRMVFSPYSVDSSLFAQQRLSFNREESRRDLGIDQDDFLFVFSGKLIPRKQPLLLLEAIRQMETRNNIALVVLGDGPLKEKVCQLGRQVLGDRFLFQGFVNQSRLGRYYVAADAFVLPSHYETWGLVVNEAMQFGLPVIVSTNVGCSKDLVLDGETGFRFQSGDASSLSKLMDHLARDRISAKRMGLKAQERIRSYSIEEGLSGILMAIELATRRRLG